MLPLRSPLCTHSVLGPCPTATAPLHKGVDCASSWTDYAVSALLRSTFAFHDLRHIQTPLKFHTPWRTKVIVSLKYLKHTSIVHLSTQRSWHFHLFETPLGLWYPRGDWPHLPPSLTSLITGLHTWSGWRCQHGAYDLIKYANTGPIALHLANFPKCSTPKALICTGLSASFSPNLIFQLEPNCLHLNSINFWKKRYHHDPICWTKFSSCPHYKFLFPRF